MENNRKINITIEGRSAKGKTTLGLVIQKALEKEGINVSYGVEQHETKHNNLKHHINNIPNILEKFKQEGMEVLITEKHLGKDPF